MAKKPAGPTTRPQLALSAPTNPAPTAPASKPAVFPIVGIGASAGGLAAFEAFFSGLGANTTPGMTFVLVQHLAPAHDSMLTELVRRFTRLPVFEVHDNMPVCVNSVYVIPPNHDLALMGGHLHLLPASTAKGQRLAIDFFFTSLAQDLRGRAIGVVLSGTGSDGALGLQAIKEAGGLVLVQTPESTEFDGMPRSALATGVVDQALTPADMAAYLLQHAGGSPMAMTTPTSASVSTATPSTVHPDATAPMDEAALKKVFVLLRSQTGHDFSQYKPSTIHRRIERRMAVHQIGTVDAYLRYLQQTPDEALALFRDLLIGVTNFFRDPEAFAALETQVVAHLFDHKPVLGGVVRVWVAGCSTGEEAYSIAILLQERMEALKQTYTVQVFATDIDARAIAVARAGVYPPGIAADMTAHRLARFFTAEPNGRGYRIHKSIRDMLVFSEQDLIKDPPFSKLDLITCRNLLIYLDANLQKRLMPMFHYALNPQGVLFLGTSEGIGDFLALFATLDRKAKLYQRKHAELGLGTAVAGRELPALSAIKATVARQPGKDAPPAKLPLRDITEQAMLAQMAPAGALVNALGDIFYLHGRTGRYLEIPPGEVGVANALKMAREGLRPALTNALHKATLTQEVVLVAGLRVKTNGHFTRVHVTVRPVAGVPPALAPNGQLASPTGQLISTHLGTPQASWYVLIFQEAPNPPVPEVTSPTLSPDAASQIAALQAELRVKDDYLQNTHEELESANEELKSSVEEMQSVNEELQSTNEELETSKEELQSVNEELSTVNNELNIKVEDLSRLNNDMNNLLAGTGIATVFVDHAQCILRFTPTASKLIHLIAADVGRPVGHIVSNLVGYSRLVTDVQNVLDTLHPFEAQVQTAQGDWYTLRITPYRTQAHVIEGAVITFSDISELKRMEAALAQANALARLAVVVRDAFDAITVQDMEGRTLAWNPGAERLYGWTAAQALQMNVRERIPVALHQEALHKVHQLSEAQVLAPYLTQRLCQSGMVLEVSLTATALVNDQGQAYAIATTERARDLPPPRIATPLLLA